MVLESIALRIRATGMVYITGLIPARCSVDVDFFVDVEDIKAILIVVGFIGHDFSDVFDDLLALRYWLHCKKAETAFCASHPYLVFSIVVFTQFDHKCFI